MGEIRVDIPRDLETAFDEAFAGQDKAAAILALIRTEIAKRQNADASAERSFDDLIEEVLRLREQPPYMTDEEIRKVREELRK
jgi:hypothetical protein